MSTFFRTYIVCSATSFTKILPLVAEPLLKICKRSSTNGFAIESDAIISIVIRAPNSDTYFYSVEYTSLSPTTALSVLRNPSILLIYHHLFCIYKEFDLLIPPYYKNNDFHYLDKQENR